MTISKEDAEIAEKLLGVMADFETLAFPLWVISRNLESGANTMTRAGLTSFGSGRLRNWPGVGPENGEVIGANRSGTVQDLATALNTDVATLLAALYKAGAFGIPPISSLPNQLNALAKALGVTVEDLLNALKSVGL